MSITLWVKERNNKSNNSGKCARQFTFIQHTTWLDKQNNLQKCSRNILSVNCFDCIREFTVINVNYNKHSNMLHTYSLFKWLGLQMIDYTIYHGTLKGTLTRLMTSYLTSLNRMTPGNLHCLGNRSRFWVLCCRIMHGSSSNA